MIVSFITKSNTFWLNSSGKDTHNFWSSLSSIVEVDTSALVLVWEDVFWASDRVGLANNKAPERREMKTKRLTLFQPLIAVETERRWIFLKNTKYDLRQIQLPRSLFHFIAVSYFFRGSGSCVHVSENQDVRPHGATLLVVPILGRQPCRLAWVSLPSVIRPAFHSPPLHRRALTSPLPRLRTVNADKRYPRPRPPPHFRSSRNDVTYLILFTLKKPLAS